MTVQSIGGETQPTNFSQRMLRSQLDIVVSSLPAMAVINPTWAALCVAPMTGLIPALGVLSAWRMAAVLGLHLVNSLIGILLFRAYRRDPSDQKRWLVVISGFQMLIGTTWGLNGWLLWVQGSAVNNAFVFATMVGMLWVYTMSRAIHLAIYFCAVVPIMILATTRMATGSGEAAPILTFLISMTFIYSFALARTTRKQVEVTLRTRFANEDMTEELMHARDDALRKRFEAEAANTSKTTFLANMSHELRTPLNAILGFSEMIASETLGPVGTRRYRDYANDINASGTHLLSIINDILDVAKIEAGKMEISPQFLNPKDAIDKSLGVIFARAREQSQSLTVDCPDDPSALFVDERAFKQIVINLASNAIKFTPRGGSIALRGRRMPDGGFELCVEDDGPGISANLLDRIFMPFNQIDNRYNRHAGGTGLGLSLVRGLAELHGGRAWIESEAGAGVRAYVYFPVGNVAATGLARMIA